VNVRTRPRAVTEFLIAEGSTPTEIHRRSRSEHGEDAIDVSSDAGSVGEKDMGDWPRSASVTSFMRPAYIVSGEAE
jgi:hypothetical protein